MNVEKIDNTFTTFTVNTPSHLVCKNCVKLETLMESIEITGNDHDITINLEFELNEDCKLLEPAVKTIFKKIFTRLKIYIESL